jgi:hypothetical protein
MVERDTGRYTGPPAVRSSSGTLAHAIERRSTPWKCTFALECPSAAQGGEGISERLFVIQYTGRMWIGRRPRPDECALGGAARMRSLAVLDGPVMDIWHPQRWPCGPRRRHEGSRPPALTTSRSRRRRPSLCPGCGSFHEVGSDRGPVRHNGQRGSDPTDGTPGPHGSSSNHRHTGKCLTPPDVSHRSLVSMRGSPTLPLRERPTSSNPSTSRSGMDGP